MEVSHSPLMGKFEQSKVAHCGLVLIWIWSFIYCYLLVETILQGQEYGVEILSAM